MANNTLYTVNYVNIDDLSTNCLIIYQMLKQNKCTPGNHEL